MRLGSTSGRPAAICLAAMAGPLIVLAGTAAPATAAAAAPAAPRHAGTAAGGPLLAWGDNQYGQLGDGTVTGEDTPGAVNPPADLRARSARVGTFGIAVGTSGQVWTWGRGEEGELGNGATTDRHRPVRVRLPGGAKVSAVRAGADFAVALTTAGRVLAWGLGTSGQLGDGARQSSDLPVWVRLPRGVLVKAISAGADSAFALTRTGRVLAWGDNQAGELGDGRPADADRPVWVAIPHHATITTVGAGVDHVLAVTAAGGLLAWGSNSAFDLGDGKPGIRRTPARVLLPHGVKVVEAFAGRLHSLALTVGGRVLAWGDNEAGQLGDGSFTNRPLPVYALIPRHDRIVTLAAGRDFSLALTSSGKILAWGDDGTGELGDGMDGTTRDVPFQIAAPGKVIAIGAGCDALSAMAVVTKIID